MWVSNETTKNIPIIFYKNLYHSDLLIIFFHGNAEDAGIAISFVENVCDEIKAHAIIAEYPEYGIYSHEKVSVKKIYSDTLAVFDFAVNELKF